MRPLMHSKTKSIVAACIAAMLLSSCGTIGSRWGISRNSGDCEYFYEGYSHPGHDRKHKPHYKKHHKHDKKHHHHHHDDD